MDRGLERTMSLSKSTYTVEPKPLGHSVAECMDEYFRTLNGHTPKTLNLYETVLEQIEPPLLRATLQYCDGNQSRAAELLGLNRATLRKKLTQYKISRAR